MSIRTRLWPYLKCLYEATCASYDISAVAKGVQRRVLFIHKRILEPEMHEVDSIQWQSTDDIWNCASGAATHLANAALAEGETVVR